MLPKKNRFSFKNRLPRQILNFPSFSVRYEKNDEGLKVGVVVSRKVDKRAVVRNRIKRVILETVRKNLETDKNLNLVFYVKKQAAENSNLEKEVKDATQEIASSLRSSQ